MRPALSRKEPSKPDPTKFQKILLVRLRRIGDIVMTTPAVTALKKALPRASLTYVVEEPFRRLVEGNPCLADVLVLKTGGSSSRTVGRPDDFHESDSSPASRPALRFIELVRHIRAARYDALIDFHGGPRASWLTLFSGAGHKVGYMIKNKGFLYDIVVPRGPAEGHIHSVVNHVNLVKALGVEVPEIPRLFLPGPKKEEAGDVDRFIRENGLQGSKIVVLHIGAGNRFREWGTENHAALAGLLQKTQEAKVVLVGGRENEAAARVIIRKAQAHSLVGRNSLIELRELIARAALFVGADSGPMHIAATTQTPIVALFGPNIPAIVAPWKAKVRIVEKALGCRPCKQRECVHTDFRCLRSISPEEVFKACAEFL